MLSVRKIITCFFLILIGLAMNSILPAASIAVPLTSYSGVSLKKLILTYKEAYKAQNFYLIKSSIYQEKNGLEATTIVFNYRHHDHPNWSNGTMSFVIISDPKNKKCMPCQIYRQTYAPGGPSKYNYNSYKEAQYSIINADARALTEVKKKLGTSVPAMPLPNH